MNYPMLKEAHMIVVKNNEASEYYANYCTKTWESANIKVNRFRAVTPSTYEMREIPLKFGKFNRTVKYRRRKIDAEITATEKCVFASHYDLWRHCAYSNEPLMVLEHDAYLERPEDLWYDPKYGVIFFDKASMGSYIIQPWFAKMVIEHLLDHVIDTGPFWIIRLVAMKHKIEDLLVNETHPLYKPVSNQVMSKKYGGTVEHYCTTYPEGFRTHEFKMIE